MTIGICFVEKLRKHRRLQPGGAEWESGNWDVSTNKAELLLGKRIYFHERQADRSYFGGVITGYRILPPDDPDNPGRIVFRFTRDEAGTGFLAGSEGWSYEQKTLT